MTQAIFGATGAVGGALAAELAKKGMIFRVIGRSEERLRHDFAAYEPLVEYCEADVDDPQSAAVAARRIDTIFYTVGVPYNRFELHPNLMRIALDAAAAGVRRFVHVSTVYPYGLPQRDFVDESHPRTPHTYKGRMRKEQEDLVLAADAAVVCAPPFCGHQTFTIPSRSSVMYATSSWAPPTVAGPT